MNYAQLAGYVIVSITVTNRHAIPADWRGKEDLCEL
jgi:hypothetical protein